MQTMTLTTRRGWRTKVASPIPRCEQPAVRRHAAQRIQVRCRACTRCYSRA